MQLAYTPYIIPILITAAIAGWVAAYSWVRRKVPSAMALSLLALAITLWSVGYAGEVAAADLPTKLLLAKFQYLGIVSAPLFWTIFAANHASQGKSLSHRLMFLIAAVPVATVLLVATNERHGWVWSRTGLESSSGFLALDVSYGPWFWVHSAYSYLLLLAGTVIVLRSVGRMTGLYRGQTGALILGVLAPWLGNAIYLSGLSPIPNLDLTPFAFTITLLALSWGILGFRLISLAPVARDLVIEEMTDGMLVLDGQNRVVDINPAAQRLTGRPANQVVGQPVEAVLANWLGLVNRYLHVNEIQEEIQLDDADGPRYYELRLSPLYDRRRRFVGRVLTLRNITARRLAEAQLRQLSHAVESSPVSIVITGADGAIQYVNPRFTQVTGYSAAEAYGQNPRILKSDLTPQEVHSELWATLLAGKEWRGEFCNRKKSGELYWESASISPLLDTQGKITHFVAVKEDITEQRRVREQFRQQNDYLSVLHEVTLDLLNRRELNDLLQAVVDRAALLLDAPYGEIMLREGEALVVRACTGNQSLLLGEQVGPEEARLSWQVVTTGQPAVLADYATWSQRRSVYSDMHAVADFPVMVGERCIAVVGLGRSQPNYPFTPEQVQTGVLFARLVALVLDNANLYDSALQELSERKRAEARLQESEARYRQIIENASDIIYRTDARGFFTYVNQPALCIMGFTHEDQVLGKSYLELATPDARAGLKRFYLRQYLSRQPNTYYEFTAFTAEGHKIWLGQNVQIIMEGESVAGFQAVARDITERKNAEEALALARDQALEASRLKTMLLAKVSHELRTPLGGILGYAELLYYDSFGPLTEKQKFAASQIVESANYLKIMVNELLDEAQMEARTLVLRRDKISPGAILQKVEAALAVVARNKGLTFSIYLSPGLPEWIYGDEHRLEQILLNLTGNAIKFTSKGAVRVSLERPRPTHWSLSVCDTGAGIPPEAQAYIFEPYRQVDNAVTRANRGSGLGLSITKQLVELMGGIIRVESEVGQGTTFVVTLPLDEVERNEL